jgi:hypothetical protein
MCGQAAEAHSMMPSEAAGNTSVSTESAGARAATMAVTEERDAA